MTIRGFSSSDQRRRRPVYHFKPFKLSTALMAVHKNCYARIGLIQRGGPRRRETTLPTQRRCSLHIANPKSKNTDLIRTVAESNLKSESHLLNWQPRDKIHVGFCLVIVPSIRFGLSRIHKALNPLQGPKHVGMASEIALA